MVIQLQQDGHGTSTPPNCSKSKVTRLIRYTGPAGRYANRTRMSLAVFFATLCKISASPSMAGVI